MALNDHFIYSPPQQPLSKIYEDEDIIIIDKPAGLLSVMGRLPEHQDSAYLRILAEYPAAKVTHRLDMATSGLLMFAKHRTAEVAISKLFQARQIEKQYIAWVQGQIAAQGQVDVPLLTDWDNRPKQRVDFALGKHALTLFRLQHYDAVADISRVQLTPMTGRSHQLRVHMQYIGHPIMGDKLYHPNAKAGHFTRMALHAYQLTFSHPITGQALQVEAQTPF
ncbi:RluA family pseudouridine synthase [Acinetobacter larvae]|uniref:RNA pseudouridine synthase n=1 Tax=Acinetobacter larvae TaxID=1789224 RepID=A0A1B2LX47_9GAMM|nr:pseudouridine synthase [Acinetobacter larvae]AOA57518.1 RNA pseudouridine synthase [Acinetobacter larvae]